MGTVPTFIIYFWVGLNINSASHFFIFYGISLILVLTGTGLGFLGGTIYPTKELAVTLHPMLDVPLMALSGFYVNESHILLFSSQFCT